MTDEQIKNWKRERDIAREIADEDSRKKALEQVYDHRDEMMMECIAHQSNRVKEIMKDHADMLKSHKQYQEERAEMRGIKKALNMMKWIAAVGGSGGIGAAIMKILEAGAAQ